MGNIWKMVGLIVLILLVVVGLPLCSPQKAHGSDLTEFIKDVFGDSDSDHDHDRDYRPVYYVEEPPIVRVYAPPRQYYRTTSRNYNGGYFDRYGLWHSDYAPQTDYRVRSRRHSDHRR